MQQYRKELTPSFASDSEGQISALGHLLAINEAQKERLTHPLGGGGSLDINGLPKNINSELIVRRNGNGNGTATSSSPLPTKKSKQIFNKIRKLTMSYDNSSLYDSYTNDVATEEIPLDDFDDNQRKALRISEDNRRST